MKIIVIGCGKIGRTILSDFVAEGHEVLAMDTNPDVLKEIANIYDIMTLCGNGADYTDLYEAGAQNANLVIAATGSDEYNMLSCFVARRMGARHTVARIRNPEMNDEGLAFMKEQLHLSMAINPELMAARELFNILKLPAAAKIETFSAGKFEMIELIIKDDSPLNGMVLMELNRNTAAKFLICVVERDGEVYIPDGSFTLKGGDRIALTAAPTEVQKLLKSFGALKKHARDIMILGGSKVAYYLAKMLIKSGNSVKIIEQNPTRAAALADSLPGAVIINGDGASQELLLEEGISTTDAFVALTGMDEENILISSFAFDQNVKKVITKINRVALYPFAKKLGIDTIISPKQTVSNVLSRYARALENSLGSKVESLYRLMDGKAEVIEFVVAEDFKYANTPLKELSLKQNLLITGIIRNRKTIIPTGNDVILPCDRVIIAATGHRLLALEDIMR